MRGWSWLPFLAASGCGKQQSALIPGGEQSEAVIELLAWMTGGATLIWLVVSLLFWAACRGEPRIVDARHSRWLIIGGGAVIPTTILTGLLTYGLSLIPDMESSAAPGSPLIEVGGVQWWWRVRYLGRVSETDPIPSVATSVDPAAVITPQGDAVETANELVLPAGREVQLLLRSEDVIHSFWVPSLAGKVDMIPGRINAMKIEAEKVGEYRGACAEYCGASHAWMALNVKVVPPDEFDRWLAQQRRPAARPQTELAQRGRIEFFRSGCGACHAIRGTSAQGRYGPDLTHVGSRRSLGAGRLRNEPVHRAAWIRSPGRFKPGVHMPGFDALEGDAVEAIAAYLDSLR